MAGMATFSRTAAPQSFVPVEEYLRSAYDPDLDYVDGVLEDRNVGEFDHARVQRALLFILARMERAGGFFAIQELRVQVSETRYRVPDLCVLPADRLPKKMATEPPMLCIEVLSPLDTFSRTQEKGNDYLRMGVPEVWIFDPETRVVFVMRDDQMTEQRRGDLSLQGTAIQLSLEEVFAVLDGASVQS